MRGNRFSTDLDINFLLFLRLHRVKAFLQANTDLTKSLFCNRNAHNMIDEDSAAML